MLVNKFVIEQIVMKRNQEETIVEGTIIEETAVTKKEIQIGVLVPNQINISRIEV